MKTVGGLRKLRHRGGDLVDWIVTLYCGGVQPDPPAHTPDEGDVTRTRNRLGSVIAKPQDPSAHRPSWTNEDVKMASGVTFSSAC